MSQVRIAYVDSNDATRSAVVAFLRSTVEADVVGLDPDAYQTEPEFDCLVLRWDPSIDRALVEGDCPTVLVVEPDTPTPPTGLVGQPVVTVADPGDYDHLAETIRRALETEPTLPASVSDWRLYRTLVHSLADPMYVLDEAGQVRMVNDAFVDQFDYDRADLVGENVSQFLPPDAYRRGTELLRSLVETDQADDSTFSVDMDVDGEPRTLEIKLAPMTDEDRLRGSVGTIRDVTERERRERELARYEKMLETVPVGIYAIDPGGSIVWTNGYFAEIFGREPADLIGTEFAALVYEGYFERTPEEMFAFYEDLVEELLTTDAKRIDNVGHVYADDGRRRTFAIRTGLLPFQNEQFTGTITAFREITAQVENERALERQNERLEEFASIVSHDLRNPINVARGYLEAARETERTDPLDEIGISLDRMEEIVDQMLTLAREGDDIETPSDVEVATIAERAWQTVDTAEATLSLRTERRVEADPSRLQQLFENLFRNSVEHGGPSVTVTVGDIDDGSGFYVADDGPGIPAERRESVFGTGTTTAPAGTGFGLAIVRRIVTAHGWDVTVAESDDGGARFEIECSRELRRQVQP